MKMIKTSKYGFTYYEVVLKYYYINASTTDSIAEEIINDKYIVAWKLFKFSLN